MHGQHHGENPHNMGRFPHPHEMKMRCVILSVLHRSRELAMLCPSGVLCSSPIKPPRSHTYHVVVPQNQRHLIDLAGDVALKYHLRGERLEQALIQVNC